MGVGGSGKVRRDDDFVLKSVKHFVRLIHVVFVQYMFSCN